MVASLSMDQRLKVKTLTVMTSGAFYQIYSLTVHLSDESFAVPHSKRGILGMANKGPHSNGSQFYITLQPTPWMDRTYVAFGFVSRTAF